MTVKEAKKVLETYKTRGQDEYKIPIMDVDLNDKLSGAILKLCEEQGEYAMAGYIKPLNDGGIRYYLVYKPEGKRVRFFHEEPIQKYFLSLCRLVSGNIFEMGDNGKILPRRFTGTCAKHQRHVAQEVKRARFMGFIPFCK